MGIGDEHATLRIDAKAGSWSDVIRKAWERIGKQQSKSETLGN